MEQMEATPAYIGSIKQLAKSLGVERSTLYRAFKSQLGISVHDYVDRTRRARASELLLYSDMSNSEIAEILGFSNDKYFITWFKSTHGQSPRACRIANRGKLT
jgi:AraC-like DNA-binding protein